ncbi:MAG: hypothetical protein K1W33_05300 [Clostridia bacterium]
MNIKKLLQIGIKELKENNIEDANLKCRMLLANILNVTKEYLLIHDIEELEENIVIDFNNKIEELKNRKAHTIYYL